MTATRIGFLHLGGARHGVHRYGRLLADDARKRGGFDVVEHEVTWSGDENNDARRAEQAGDLFSSCAVAHVQYNRRIWGDGFRQLGLLRRFLAHCRAPLVATLHDVYPEDPWSAWTTDWRNEGRVTRGRTFFKRVRRKVRDLAQRVPANLAVRLLLGRATTVLVSSEVERSRLASFPRHERVQVIEHFVEPRSPLLDGDAAKAALGLAGKRVVTLLGFIHPRKGHDLAVEALALLPRDVVLVFAGMPSPGNENKTKKLERRARELSAADRLRVTGWLEDAPLEQYLAASDLGLCPFRFFSASGSLSTWIATGRPVVCHELPQLEEYRSLSPGAFDLFAPYTPAALAAAIVAAFDRHGPGAIDPAVLALQERLLLPAIGERHAKVWRDAAARAERVGARAIGSDAS